MTKEQEELSVSFLFLTQGREIKDWLPALMSAVGENNQWNLFRAICDECKSVPLWVPDAGMILDRINDDLEEDTSATPERIFSELTLMQMSDLWYDMAYDKFDEIIEALRDDGMIFPKWYGENGQAYTLGQHNWHAEGERG